ncbi:MAG: hypothetical protein P4L79_15710, partial [Legionella sp.]|uniref:rolling circle replication-associated protein n=1 Tax=Legionella sp. TaxID=459 RepID=UPI00284F1A0D|nr:hypothetical protein [Legionella sp.]
LSLILYTLNQMIKKTHIRSIKSGDILEIFMYKKPLYRGFTIAKKKPSLSVIPKTLEERLKNRERSMMRSRGKVKRLVNANAYKWHTISGRPFRPLFLTLTFKENIRDLKSANYELTKFIQRFNYFITHIKRSYCKYLGVPEFQQRGAVHYHIILFNIPFIENIYDELKKLWPMGMFKVNAVDNVKNVGNYVSAYMTKGKVDTRLISQMSYTASKGLLKPKEEWSADKIQKQVAEVPKNFEQFEKDYEDPYYEATRYIKFSPK